MRKIFAYVVTTVTLIAMMVFFIPNVKDSTNFAMEYTGGFEVLYKTKSSMKDVNDNQIASTISDGMNKMLDINGVDDAIVTIEDGNYIRVSVTSKNQMISDEIRDLIQNSESYEITFRDAEDKLLATGDQILKNIGATYSGETNYYGYPIIYLNISDTDLLNEITTAVSSASTTNLVIWVGFEEGVDSYANIETNSSTAKKVIYNATVSEPLNDEVITITGNYTEEAAKNTVNLVNSGTYEYELETIQIKSIKESDATQDRTLILISLGISLLIAIVAMCVFFKLEGVYAIITILFTEFMTIFAFNKIAGVINPQVVGAFIIANISLFTLMFILLTKYKNVLKTNKSPIKAYKETFKKNGTIIIDTTVTMLLVAIVTYFLGNNAHNFAILLSCSSVAIFIGLFLLERFVMYLTCDCLNKNDRAVIVSNIAINKDEDDTTKTVKDIDNYAKPALFGFFGLVGLGLVVILITSLALKSPFNYYGDARSSSSIEIVANEEYFTSENQVMEFFDKEYMSIELDSITLENNGDKYHIIVTTSEDIALYEETLKEDLKSIYGENTDYEENYTVYINDFDTTSLSISFKSTLYTCGISLLLIAAYFALRYKYSYSLATVSSVLMVGTSMVAFFGITRIPLNSNSIISLSVVSTYSLLILVPFFTRIKEYMKDTKKIYLSYTERVDCFKKGRNSILLPTIVSFSLISAISLIVMFFDLSNFSMYLAIIIGSMFAIIYNMIFVPRIWILFENKSDKRKKTFKNRNISKSKYRTLDEQVFIGVND